MNNVLYRAKNPKTDQTAIIYSDNNELTLEISRFDGKVSLTIPIKLLEDGLEYLGMYSFKETT